MERVHSAAHSFSEKDRIWNDFINTIKDSVPNMTFNTWFVPLKPVSIDIENKSLMVQVPNSFFWEWIDEHHNSLIKRVLRSVMGEGAKIQYTIKEPEFEHEEIAIIPQKDVSSNAIEIDLVKEKPNNFDTKLNSNYTFDNFIKGEGNLLAYSASIAISQNPGNTPYNPFYVYGGVGLGKTHMIQSIGNKVVELFPEKKVYYSPASDFTTDFINSIKDQTTEQFSKKLRGVDVLIIDDIQNLSGKDSTQDIFFHIFNSLHQSGKQIILSSDKPPKDIKGIGERLISRFNWGLSVDIQPPDFETRIAIINKKCEVCGVNLSDDLIEYIAANITANIREIEGTILKLSVYNIINSSPIDLQTVKRVVSEISTVRKPVLSIDLITKTVCEQLSIDENKVRDKTRKKEIAFARQVCMYISKEMTKNTYKTIGLHFGGRDHATVLHAHSTISSMISSDKTIRELINQITNKLEHASL